MRTTVMLPPDLMRAAKARSAERGESLKALLTRALSAELEHHAPVRSQPARVTLPVFGVPGPSMRISNADLERVLAETDASLVVSGRKGTARRPARRSR